jgi:hypothetical protein
VCFHIGFSRHDFALVSLYVGYVQRREETLKWPIFGVHTAVKLPVALGLWVVAACGLVAAETFPKFIFIFLFI